MWSVVKIILGSVLLQLLKTTCAHELNEEQENPWILALKVSTLTFKDSILETARTRSDAMAKAVLARFENDLVAAEAKYHHDCFNSFLKPATGVKVGRPQDETTNLAMEELFTYIENSDERINKCLQNYNYI
ncbi:unnamed protein product [Psylliodes chrysocephalus]|uniref:Uncharacterized protein n=1 Tax=Psylliodes chrysocephalus TaxID=3402493 RepID=A0A9P0G6N8_9CUCU|nr:unnamed protein product [Psylliodes chrysocephala]